MANKRRYMQIRDDAPSSDEEFQQDTDYSDIGESTSGKESERSGTGSDRNSGRSSSSGSSISGSSSSGSNSNGQDSDDDGSISNRSSHSGSSASSVGSARSRSDNELQSSTPKDKEARAINPESHPYRTASRETGNNPNNDHIKQIEKVLADLTKAINHMDSTRGSSTSQPVNREAEESWNFSREPPKAQCSYSAVRPENIKSFPSGVRPNKMWAEWYDFIENFEVSVSLHNTNDPVYKSKLLFLSLGKDLQTIVKAANLRPCLTDSDCYTTFVRNIEDHLRSMTDIAAEHRAFLRMKQEQGESTATFHARLVRNVKLCGYSPSDQIKFVRSQLLDGMLNKKLVREARTYAYETNYIVQSSSRDEAYEAEISERPDNLSVSEVTQGFRHGSRRVSGDQSSYLPMKQRRVNPEFLQTQDRRSSAWNRGGNTRQQPGRNNRSNPHVPRSRCPKCNNTFHRNRQCPALNRRCDTCGRQGHYSIVCERRLSMVQQTARYSDGESSNEETRIDSKQSINALTLDDALIDCSVGSGSSIRFLIDSGADVNVIGGKDWLTLKREFKSGNAKLEIIQQGQKGLHAYASRNPMTIRCTFKAKVEVLGTTKPSMLAVFHVVPEGVRSLLGRSTANDLRLLQVGKSVNACATVDDGTFPKMPGIQVKFSVNSSVPPTKNAYYNVPAAFREAARQRLHDMERRGIIEKVTSAPSWISGMSAVPKGKSDFRLVVNMRAPNKAINREYFRLPLIDEMRVKLHGSKYFTKLDLSNAFYHLELNEESRELTTFLTEDGMFRFTRLMFGVNCAPEIFQREMVRLFVGIDNLIVWIDDVLIFAKTLEELRKTVKKVLQIIKANHLTLNTAKCEYDKTSITWLGQKLDGDGFHIDEEKIRSVRNFREPTTISELRSFLGLASFISPYLRNFADMSRPLWEATSKKAWTWGAEQKEAFEKIKQDIVHSTVALGFFSDNDKTILYTDASPRALGAVLVQESKDNNPRIISFASKALMTTERGYAQNQREALGAVWAVEHFSYFLLGRNFTLRTDAAGVAFILNRSREKSKQAQTRADGWALRLSPYGYDVEFVRGRDNIADPSSRLYEGEDEPFDDDNSPWEVALLEANPVQVLTEDEIATATCKDEALQLVMQALETGQWSSVHASYKKVKDDLSIRGGIIVKTGCAVVPTVLQEKALRVAHEGHPSVAKMKSIIRQRVWWPGMAGMVQKWVESCETCITNGKPERPTPMQRIFAPKVVWETIALDFNGPYVMFGGISILLIVDYRSRFLIARPVKSTSFECTRKILEDVFEKEGYPKSIKSDNGPPFNGTDYKEYCAQRGIATIFSTPLFPQQNGMVESYMKVVNKAMIAAATNKTSYVDELREAVHAHNAGTHSITKLPPEEVMLGRKVKRRLPLMNHQRTLIDDKLLDMRDQQAKLEGKRREDSRRGARECRVKPGDTVIIQRQSRSKGQSRFSPTKHTVVEEKNGSLVLNDSDGRIVKRHVSQTKKVSLLRKAKDRSTTGDGGVPKAAVEETPLVRRGERSRKEPNYLKQYVRPIEDFRCTEK